MDCVSCSIELLYHSYKCLKCKGICCSKCKFKIGDYYYCTDCFKSEFSDTESDSDTSVCSQCRQENKVIFKCSLCQKSYCDTCYSISLEPYCKDCIKAYPELLHIYL